MARTSKTIAPAPQARTARQLFKEPTTWAGLLTIGTAIATGGASLLTDPIMWGKVGAGLALILAKEGA